MYEDTETWYAGRSPLSRIKSMKFVEFSEEADGFICTDTAYPDCSAFGKTPDEAIEAFHQVVISWIKARNSAENT